MGTISRRQWLAGSAAAAASAALPAWGQTAAPASPVAVTKCAGYGSEVTPALSRLFDQLGGLGRIVKGKTITIKVNLTGNADQRLNTIPQEISHWTHPSVIGGAIHLMGLAGARRIRIVESPWATIEPLEEFMLTANWEPSHLANAASRVEFENTNFLGSGKTYSRLWTPKGGHIFKGFDLNHCYQDCDVYVSIAKLKEHATTGITLSMKNSFGITPCTIYGEGAGVDEPSSAPRSGRSPLHYGHRQPSKSAPQENDPKSPRDGGYRVPRIVADLNGARPIHLAIIDGIDTIDKGEGCWIPGVKLIKPGLLIAGTNGVCTDAVSMALMGFDPMADRGTPPFEKCDNTLRLAEELGVGTRDLKRIEVIGGSIDQLRFPFRPRA